MDLVTVMYMSGVSEQLFYTCTDLASKRTVIVVNSNAQFSKPVERFFIDITGSRNDAFLIHHEFCMQHIICHEHGWFSAGTGMFMAEQF